jgi:hypothetical protein
MDPDANIAEQMRIAQAIQRFEDLDQPIPPSLPMRLAELTIALDEWIRRGGALPQRWQR